MAIADLPPQPTSFIGREREIAEITARLDDPACRLLTLAGMGGVGKTRLALEVARRQQGSFPDSVYFVSLQPLQSSDPILQTLLNTLNLTAAENPHSALLAYLRDKRLLLVLDNFEHVLEGAALMADILKAAPQIKLLVTSREALRLQEEWLHVVHGLSYPGGGEAAGWEQYNAVQLFVERARQLRGDLDFSAQAESIARICQFVEGMPLALELAAGWVKTLSCRDIDDELRRNPALLAARATNVPDRHRSMEVVFDHSWRLLAENERVILQCFTVFRGGFGREAAVQVAGATLPLLAGLVDKSLLRHDPDTGRYSMHELLRQYAAEHLDRTPEFKEAVLDRHCAYYTALLDRLTPTIHLMNQADVVRDIDNLRMAWKRAVQQGNLAALVRAASSLYWLYHTQAWFDEGTAMFYLAEQALRQMPVTDDSRFLLGTMQLFRAYYGLRLVGHALPPVDVTAALALWEGLEERPEMGLPLSRALFTLLVNKGDPEELVATARMGIAFNQRHRDLSGVAISLTTLASVLCDAFGEFAEAQQLLEQALAIDQEIGFAMNAGWAESVLTTICNLQGRYQDAKVHCEAWLSYRQAGSIRSALDTALHTLGHAALEVGDDAAARTHFERAITVARDTQDHIELSAGYAGLGIAAAFQNDIAAAAMHYADSQTALRATGWMPSHHDGEPEDLGFLALLLGLYDRALAHYEADIARHERTGFRVSLMRAHCRAGHALIGLADEPTAERYLVDALREANRVGAFQVTLESLLGIAQLGVVPRPLAVELLVLIARHEASNRYSRTRATHRLAGIEASLEASFTPMEYAAAFERGQALNVRGAVTLVPTSGLAQTRLNQPLVDPLSPRELDVLALIADGLTNQEIADRLFIGVSTVKKHINRIFSKLDVTHRAQAVAAARALKLLPELSKTGLTHLREAPNGRRADT